MGHLASIIIPAHNEDKVIATTLTALLPGIADNSIEVIVVCNGCTDKTARIAASMSSALICLETPVASKVRALNLGDAKARWFPRIYQDADVVLTMDAVAGIVETLRKGPFLAAAPAMRMEYHEASWAVRSYYAIWQALPYVQEGLIGVGVYALSEEGRRRFDSFPDIIADDGYLRALFQPYERTVIGNCWSLVRAPNDLRGLLKIKTRSRRGRYQLARKFPQLMGNEHKEYGKALLPLAGSLSLWPKIAVYLYVNLIARFLANRHITGKVNGEWERDESSRDAAIRNNKESHGKSK